MKLAFANSSRIWGGAEIITTVLMRGLLGRGHEVMLLCRRGSPFIERIGGEVPCSATLGGFDAHPWSVVASTRALARARPELLVTMTQKDPRTAGVAARLLRIPVLLRQPMDIGFRPTLHHRFFYGAIPTHYVANSRATRDSMLKSAPWLSADEVEVIYNGIDVEDFARARPVDLGLPVGALAVGFVGRFEDRKGVRELMAAWPTIAASVPNAYLVLAGGGGPLDAEVRAWSDRSERVRLIGFRDDMPGVMAGLDIFVMPSHFEGFGIALVEAMSAGVAVVASRASNLPELVDDGVEGRLVTVGDASAIAGAVVDLAHDPERRRDLALAGQARARRDFHVELMLDEYEDLFRSIANGIPRKPRILTDASERLST